MRESHRSESTRVLILRLGCGFFIFYFSVVFVMNDHYEDNINPILGLLQEKKNTDVIYLF